MERIKLRKLRNPLTPVLSLWKCKNSVLKGLKTASNKSKIYWKNVNHQRRQPHILGCASAPRSLVSVPYTWGHVSHLNSLTPIHISTLGYCFCLSDYINHEREREGSMSANHCEPESTPDVVDNNTLDIYSSLIMDIWWKKSKPLLARKYPVVQNNTLDIYQSLIMDIWWKKEIIARQKVPYIYLLVFNNGYLVGTKEKTNAALPIWYMQQISVYYK